MRVRRRTTALLIATLVVWMLVCVLIGVVATEGTLHPARNPVSTASRQRAIELAAANDAQFGDVSVIAADGAQLRAWFIKPPGSGTDAVILLHGQADNRAGMLGPAGLLLHHGYSVLMPDARAHGDSAGPIATYGVLEADDVHRWFDWMLNTNQPHCIYGIGDSMGAAQLLRSIAEERGFCAVAAESAFASFREVAYDRFGQWFGTGPWLGRTLLHPAIDFGFVYARFRYGINFAQASPIRAVAATSTPVLLIHGLADTNIPPRHSEQIKRANPSVVLWEPPHAEHCGASSADPGGYEAHILAWFTAYDHP